MKMSIAVATVAAIGAAALIPTEASAGGGKGGGGMGGGYHGHGHWGGGFGGISSPLTFKRFGDAVIRMRFSVHTEGYLIRCLRSYRERLASVI